MRRVGPRLLIRAGYDRDLLGRPKELCVGQAELASVLVKFQDGIPAQSASKGMSSHATDLLGLCEIFFFYTRERSPISVLTRLDVEQLR